MPHKMKRSPSIDSNISPDNIFDIAQILDMADEYFWLPDRLVPFPHWVGHIPFAFWLMKTIKPRRFVELGTHRGNSYCAMCQAVAALQLDAVGMAVDTWDGDVHMAREIGLLDELRAYHDPRYGGFSTLARATFDDARQYFAEGSLDLLHLDGTHTYDAVRHDFELWRPTLSPRGIILFHDIEVRRDDFGVWRLWGELSSQYPSFRFTHSHGLGVLAIGREQPPVLNALLGMEQKPNCATLVRKLFATRGNALVDRLMRRESEQEALRTATHLAERETLITDLQGAVTQRDTQIEDLQGAVTQRDTQIGDLKQSLVEREHLTTALFASRSWRMTQPFRSTSRALRIGLAATRALHGRVDRLPHTGNHHHHPNTSGGENATNTNTGADTTAAICHGIDSLSLADGVISISGWIFSSGSRLRTVELGIPTETSTTWVSLRYGQPSPDIEYHYSTDSGAKNCRFFARIEAPPDIAQRNDWFLRIDNDSEDLSKYAISLDIASNHLHQQTSTPHEFLTALDTIKGVPIIVFADHGMGGGANQVRAREVNDLTRAGRATLILSFSLSTGYELQAALPSGAVAMIRLQSVRQFFDLISSLDIAEFVVNNLVSYPKPLAFQKRVAQLRSTKSTIRIRVMLHDHFPLCPSWSLENSHGEFCDIPDIQICETCMRETTGSFLALAPRVSPTKWRREWQHILSAADEIRAFSRSTADLFRRVYPELSNRLTVVPHKMDPVSEPFPGHGRANRLGRWTVATVGHISRGKGSKILVEIQALARARSAPIDIIVIGNITDPISGHELYSTGPYKQHELPRLLRYHEVSAVLLPFILPETFSYTTHEMCNLGIPLVVTNIGAPAERVAGYENGLVADPNPENILNTLISLLRRYAYYPW